MNANLSEHSPSLITSVFNGQYYDYSPLWYSDIGSQITVTMIISSLMPYFYLLYEYIMIWFFLFKDRGFSGDVYRTKQTTMAGYKYIYIGYDFLVHFQYSWVVSLTYTACFYGIQMPILFFIIAFALFNQKICDRISVGYNCVIPPSMGSEMRDQITKLLHIAPILLLFNAFWVLDSKSLFENLWTHKSHIE